MELTIDKKLITKYPELVDSGIDWVGKIPKHWKLLANKHIFKLKKNQVGKNSIKYTLLSLTLNGVIKRDMENPQGKFPAEFDTYQEVNSGDFIFCLFDVEETPRCVGLSDYNGMITGAYTVLETNDKFNKRFLYYFYLNLDNDKRLRPLYTGLRNTISKDNFFSFKSFVPPLPEQTAIAEFLDKKTVLIDQAIKIKQKQIELLKERKQILIQKAVTRGLNPNVKMKDSGVEWIGEIPENWKVTRFKYISTIKKGKLPRKIVSTPEKDLPVYMSMEYLRGGEENQWVYDRDAKTIPEDQTLLLWDGSNAGEFIKSRKGVISSTVAEIEFSNIDKNFAWYYSKFLEIEIRKKTIGMGIPHVNGTDLKNLPVLIPPIKEQIQIVEYIDNIFGKITISTSLKEKEIDKLKEYKSTLINSAVTGKIKVC